MFLANILTWTAHLYLISSCGKIYESLIRALFMQIFHLYINHINRLLI